MKRDSHSFIRPSEKHIIDEPDPFAQGQVEMISDILKENDEYRKRILAIQGLKVCPECRYTNPREARFCMDCGHKFSETELEPVPVIPKKTIRICPVCRIEAEDEMNFCLECGRKLVEVEQESGMPDSRIQAQTCSVCGAAVNDGDLFCENCGNPIQ